MVVLVAAFPWLVFPSVVGLLVLTKSLSWGRAAALLIATFVGAVLLKWGALASGEWAMRTMLPPGDVPLNPGPLVCACWIDAPLLLALAVWLAWGPLAARHREVKLQRALDLVKQTGKDSGRR